MENEQMNDQVNAPIVSVVQGARSMMQKYVSCLQYVEE